jgi:hypothetical protein
MAQVTIYLPDDVEKKVRQEARRARKSLSSYMAELAAGRVQPGRQWPEGFAELFGSWEGDFPLPADAPPDEVDAF